MRTRGALVGLLACTGGAVMPLAAQGNVGETPRDARYEFTAHVGNGDAVRGTIRLY